MTKKQKIARQTNWDKRCLTAAKGTIERVESNAENGLNKLHDHGIIRNGLRTAVSYLDTCLGYWPKGGK